MGGRTGDDELGGGQGGALRGAGGAEQAHLSLAPTVADNGFIFSFC